jgi:mono/diheme cytochrome c family protein
MRTLAPILSPLVILGLLLSTAGVRAQQAPAPAQAPPAKTEAPPEASANDIDGGQMFATLCGFCHQDGGRAEGRGPKLAGSKKSDDYLLERIRKGKPGAMPGFGGTFSEGQIIAILAYIRGLDE